MTSILVKTFMAFIFNLMIMNQINLTSSAGDIDTINLVTLGARPDGMTDSSRAFLSAWTAACESSSPSTTIYVPQGRYLVESALTFSGSNCKSNGIRFVINGTLVSPVDYNVLGNAGSWFHFRDVVGVQISGGVFDGQGAALWACKRSGITSCPPGTTTLRFTRSMNIAINGITSLDSQLFHIVIEGCQNVQVQGVNVSASRESPNTDGIHVQRSSSVTILNSFISTGDDCVSIGVGTNNSWIENTTCRLGHGISIGSLGKEVNEPGVQNLTIKTANFIDTTNGVRIKSWSRPSNGYVRNVMFQHLTMVNAQNPIIIDQNYCPYDDEKDCPKKDSGVRISDITYQDIHGSSASSIAMKFECSSKYQCTNIMLDDITLTYKTDQEAQSSCVNVVGSTHGVIKPKSCF